jgi:hypothetical protein
VSDLALLALSEWVEEVAGALLDLLSLWMLILSYIYYV